MNWLRSNLTARKLLSLKNFLLTFFMCATVVTWIGLSAIQADENDPGDYVENSKVDFQNAAQRQHAKNIAIKAVLQDDEVKKEISDLKESGDHEAVRSRFKEEVRQIMCEISKMRADGEGWGNIAKYYGVHPGYLGLGHFKNNKGFANKNHSSQNLDGSLALGQGKSKGGDHGLGNGHSNGNGNGLGNGHGNGNGNGLGNGLGNGNGNGGGNGNGNGGGHGGGHGGGNK